MIGLGLLLLCACTSINEKDILHLNGYWEIENVKAQGETFAPKGAATLVDYYSLETPRKGFRKKLRPSFNQSYESSEDITPFVILQKKDGYYLQYTTRYDQWEEKISTLNATQLVLTHQGKKYRYKRHEKYSF